MPFNPRLPYNELPDLPPVENLENERVLKALIDAHKALARLEGSITHLPNPGVLLDSIGLQEAKVSSEIENIITTNDDLYQFAVAERGSDKKETTEVLHYKDALWQGHQDVRARGVLTTNLFVKLVQIIKENDAGIRNVPGTQVASDRTGEVIYTPPTGEDIIRNKLANLETFFNTNDDDLDPLTKMAIGHYQFEAIHPFSDGNGRTGRIINILYLVQQELLSYPILYMSRYILENKSDYYRLLREVTETNEWQSWLLYMIRGVEETSKSTLEKIETIRATMSTFGDAVKKSLPKIYSKELIEVLFQRPYSKRLFLTEAGLVQLKTAGTYLNALEEEGFLKSVELGKEKLYLNKMFLDALVK